MEWHTPYKSTSSRSVVLYQALLSFLRQSQCLKMPSVANNLHYFQGLNNYNHEYKCSNQEINVLVDLLITI